MNDLQLQQQREKQLIRVQRLIQEGLETSNPLRIEEVLMKIASELGISPFLLESAEEQAV